mmetsp:Transcript_123896/g.396688  ORF Transcript_123896/g.396688 Transcript_123896/m.396688 type:complete len:202 (+) Transcript_123896:4146-4751(+)
METPRRCPCRCCGWPRAPHPGRRSSPSLPCPRRQAPGPPSPGSRRRRRRGRWSGRRRSGPSVRPISNANSRPSSLPPLPPRHQLQPLARTATRPRPRRPRGRAPRRGRWDPARCAPGGRRNFRSRPRTGRPAQPQRSVPRWPARRAGPCPERSRAKAAAWARSTGRPPRPCRRPDPPPQQRGSETASCSPRGAGPPRRRGR